MRTLPFKLPSAYKVLPGQSASTSVVDTGGYDVMVGGFGFRLANDTQFPYSRASEPTTTHRFDSSLEPGEQSLSVMPWVKSQASFHAGAGQLNLEQGFTAFQYQQEQVQHVRFDTSLGVNVWTPGQVSRLPDCAFYGFSFTANCMVTATVGGVDYAIIGGQGGLYQVKWASGPDSAPTVTSIDLSGTNYGGASNCNITSLCTDGTSYFGVLQMTAVGSVAFLKTYIISGSVGATTAPTPLYQCPSNPSGSQVPAVVGWAKARLLGCVGTSVYELSQSAAANSTLPTAKYTHPSPSWTWSAVAESPVGILCAGTVGAVSSILQLTLDTSGNTPTLGGGSSVATLPIGETITALNTSLGSFLAIATTRGIRIGTFDTYTGALKYGPLSVTTTAKVNAVTSRDRFVYGSFTNQQADGSTGLVCVDLSFVVDANGRLAHAPDLRPNTAAPTGQGVVAGVSVLPLSGRLVYVTPEGIHTEGNGPGSNGLAWIRTSRIRYDTTENKLFKLGRIRGTLDTASIQVTGIAPFASNVNLGTFGFLSTGDPGEFGLVDGLHEWIQLQFTLNGSACVFNSYHVKAYPSPKRQQLITVTLNCFRQEVDRFGLEVVDPQLPRQRLQNIIDMASGGQEVLFVEFTNTGSVAQLVRVEDYLFQEFSRPNVEDDLGGYITLKMRTTEN